MQRRIAGTHQSLPLEGKVPPKGAKEEERSTFCSVTRLLALISLLR